MADFFVRENPLLGSYSKGKDKDKEQFTWGNVPNASAETDAPVMLDYGEFGFPDEQVVREWTILGCMAVIFSTLCITGGIGILCYIFWPAEKTEINVDPVVVAEAGKNQGFNRVRAKAYSVNCRWNYPSASLVTPDGRYLVTSGGPRMRTDDIEDGQRRQGSEVDSDSGLDSALDQSDTSDSLQEVPLLSYNSSPSKLPSSVYVDLLNLNKNGKRFDDLAKQTSRENILANTGKSDLDELNEDGVDHTDLISLTGVLPIGGDDLGMTDPLYEAYSDDNVWRKSRPETESFPMAFWSMETMKPLVVHWNHEYPIIDIAVSPCGTKVVSVDGGGNAILWSLDDLPGENGVSVPTWRFVNKMTPRMRAQYGMGRVQSIRAVTFTPSGKQFVMAAVVNALDETGNSYSTCGALILWDIENWREVLRKRGTGGLSNKIDTYYQTFNPVGKFCDLAFTPNGKYLIAAAAGANAGVYYFDNRSSNPGYGICMADNSSNRKRPRNTQTSEFKPNLVQGVSNHDFPSAESVSLAISPEIEGGKRDQNSLTVVSADNYGRIVFWEFAPKTNRPREGVKCSMFWNSQNTENTTRNIRKVLFSRDARQVMFLGDDVILYSARAPYDYVGTFQALEGDSLDEQSEYFLVSGYFTPDNKYFFGGGDDCKLRMWRMDELPVDSRFVSQASQKEADGDAPKTFEDIQKEYEEVGGSVSERRARTEEEEEAAWEEEREKRKEEESLKKDFSFTEEGKQEIVPDIEFGN